MDVVVYDRAAALESATGGGADWVDEPVRIPVGSTVRPPSAVVASSDFDRGARAVELGLYGFALGVIIGLTIAKYGI